MAQKVLERRAATSTASEADRPARQRDLAAAERALSPIEPRGPRPQATCPFEPCIIESQTSRTVHQRGYPGLNRPSGRLGGRFVWSRSAHMLGRVVLRPRVRSHVIPARTACGFPPSDPTTRRRYREARLATIAQARPFPVPVGAKSGVCRSGE
jgi:hypothetical protein